MKGYWRYTVLTEIFSYNRDNYNNEIQRRALKPIRDTKANAEKQSEVHNHPLPSEWKISPKVLEDITITAQNNSRVTPKELQNGVGMSYIPMEVSLPAANLERIRTHVKRARQDVEKIDNERVNPF